MTFDERGELVSALNEDDGSGMLYTYSVDGTLTKVWSCTGGTSGSTTELGSYKYDHNGIRTEKTVDGATRYYSYANGKAIVSSASSGTFTYVYDGEEILGAYSSNAWHDYLTDLQGSTMGILKQDGTTAASFSYSDYGETTALSGSDFGNEVCYTGSIYDWESGEYYLNARYYDPAAAAFLSQDTYRGDIGDYAQWDLYAYCAGGSNQPL